MATRRGKVGDPRLVPVMAIMGVEGLAVVHALRLFLADRVKDKRFGLWTRVWANATSSWLSSITDANYQHVIDNAGAQLIEPTDG